MSRWLALSVIAFAAGCDEPEPTFDDGGTERGVDAPADADPLVPDTMFTRTPALLDREPLARFEFEATVPAATFRCALDGGEPALCASPHLIAVAEGERRFDVAAVNGDRVDPSTATFIWRVDLTPPNTAITHAPANVDNSTTVSFEFAADEEATYQCRLDGGALEACASPHTVDHLTDGDHSFEVLAADLAGNVEVDPARHAWSVDTSAPDTTIDTGPSGVVAVRVATFAFSSPDAGPGATFACALDGAPLLPCVSPRALAGLTDGEHSFSVRVTDATGNVDPTPAVRRWTVDATAPVVAITGGPDGLTGDSTPTFTFTATGATTLACRTGAAAFAACTSPYTTAVLADGAHTVEVRATDAAGNAASASRSFTVDATAPVVAITGGPDGLTGDSTPTFTFAATGATTLACRVGTAAFAACTSPYTTAALADGAHTVEVRATDAAGNAASASRSFTVDATAPVVAITGGPDGLTGDSTPTFTFTATGATTLACRTGAAAFAACTSPYTTAVLADGAHTVEVRATDAAGNAASASRSFTVDATAPVVAITGGPDGLTGDSTPTFTFAATGATTLACRVDAAAFAPCTSPFTTVALADGAHTLEVRATDAAGNAASASRSFTIDATPPVVTITAGPSGPTSNRTPMFTFTATGAATLACRVGAAAFAPCTSPYTTAVLADGAYTVEVRATDAAGNAASASRSFTVDATPPVVLINGGPDGPTSDNTPTFNFTVVDATDRGCRIYRMGSTPPSFLPCSSPVTSGVLTDGAYTFEAGAADATGNLALAQRNFTVDTVAPWVDVWAGPGVGFDQSSATFSFSVPSNPPPASVVCRVRLASSPGGPFLPCTSPRQEWLGAPAGESRTFTFEVEVRDAAGNVGRDSWTFVQEFLI